MKALYALALVTGMAYAQSGVPLTTPAAPDARAEAKAREVGAANVFPVKVNPAALESNIVTVTIEGKEYRFTGRKTPGQGTQHVNGKAVANTLETWTGS